MPHLPNFLIVGFPKCGTHALLRNLGRHPDVFTHPHEARFFGKPGRSLDEYRALFDTDKRLRGEQSPIYVAEPAAMQAIAETLPYAKLIVCIRHPIQMLHSFWNFRVWEFESGYPAGIDPAEWPFARIVLEDRMVSGLGIRRGRYADDLEGNLLSRFDRRNVCIVIQERMWASMRSEMNRVFTFLGVEPWDAAWDVINSQNHGRDCYARIDYESADYRRALARLVAEYREPNRALFELLGDDVSEWRRYDALYDRLARG